MTVEGPAFVKAKAWRSHAEPGSPEEQARLAAWLLTGPWHPNWRWWLVGVVHLGPVLGAPDVPDSLKHYPGAEYELTILSLDPGEERERESQRDPEDRDSWMPHLEPAEVVYQFDGVGWKQAAELGEWICRLCVEGKMSPDSDFRSTWGEHLRHRVAALKG